MVNDREVNPHDGIEVQVGMMVGVVGEEMIDEGGSIGQQAKREGAKRLAPLQEKVNSSGPSLVQASGEIWVWL